MATRVPLQAACLCLALTSAAGARAQDDPNSLVASPEGAVPTGAAVEAASAETVERLARLLTGSESFKVRATAAVALGRLEDERALPSLLYALDSDPHFAVRAAAASALARLGHTSAIPALLQRLEDPDPLVRAQAEEALARFHEPRHLLAFREALRSENRAQRRAAVLAYGEVLRAGHEPAALPVVNALADDDPEIRALAERALNTVGHERALPILLGGLANGSASVRAASARLLGTRLDERAIEPLLVALMKSGEPKEVRVAVRDALRQHREYIDFAALLKDAEQTKERERRLQALRLLGALGDEAALGVLGRALGDGDALVRTTAARALADLGGLRARSLVESAARREQEPRVKRHLELVLKSFRERG